MTEFTPGMNFDDFLAHHGIKGMKWGIRKDAGHEGEEASLKTIKKVDAAFERGAQNPRIHQQILNEGAAKFNSQDLPKINNHPKYKGKDLSTPSALRTQYDTDLTMAMAVRLNEASRSLGTNASGTRHIEVLVNQNGHFVIRTMPTNVRAVPASMRHSDSYDISETTIEVDRNNQGFVTACRFIAPVTHSEEVAMDSDTTLVHSLLDEIRTSDTNLRDKPSLDELMHYGKKGMKWGHRMSSADKADAIRGARDNVKAQKRAIGKQARIANNARGTSKEGSEQQKLADMRKAYLKNPDRATALRYTRGEKIATGIINVAVPISVAGNGGVVATRKTIERRQREGYYN